jgi:hypothetical protein
MVRHFTNAYFAKFLANHIFLQNHDKKYKKIVMKFGNTLGQRLGVLLFLPSAGVDPCEELIQLSPSSCGGSFLVNGVGRMIGCGGRRRRELLIDREGARSKGGPNRHRNPLGWSERVGRPRPFLGRFGPVFLPAAHLGIFEHSPLDLCHFEVVIPAIKIGGLLV